MTEQKEKRIPLVEMFGPTIQGEGAVIGQQTYFMRFGLCDYKCVMCDSMNAVDPKQVKQNAQWLTQEEIYEQFAGYRNELSTRWITLSGGNPCIHDLEGLVDALHGDHYRIAVETQGTKCPSWLAKCDIITVSPKGPGMGEDTNLEVLDGFLQTLHEAGASEQVAIKIVVFDQRDLEFAKLIWERYQFYGYPFYLSQGNPQPPGFREEMHLSFTEYVMFQIGNYKVLFEDIKDDPILSQMRFLPQLHTWFWGNDKGR